MTLDEEKTREKARKALAEMQPLEKLLFIEEGLRLLEDDIFYNIETEAERITARKIQNARKQLFNIYIKESWK